jgi:hypothetical protein
VTWMSLRYQTAVLCFPRTSSMLLISPSAR